MANFVVRAAERYSTRAQNRLVERLRAVNALTAARAVTLTPKGRGEARMLARMTAFQAIREEGGRHWLDEQALVHFRKEELARVLGAIAVAGFAAAGAIALGR